MSKKDTEIDSVVHINTLPVPVILTDDKGVIVFWNQASEDLWGLSSKDVVKKNITNYLSPLGKSPHINEILNNLEIGKVVTYEYLVSSNDRTIHPINLKASILSNNDSTPIGVMIVLISCMPESFTLNQLKNINHELNLLGNNYEENINTITALCGKLLNAHCALYNRLNDGMLCAMGQWQTPFDYNSKDNPEGHICYDVIKRATDGIYYVENLNNTSYYDSDPNVRKYNLKTYIGHLVKCLGEPVGSLCVVFNNEFSPTEMDQYILGMLSLAIGNEESQKQLQDKEKMFQEMIEFAAVGILTVSCNGIIKYANTNISKITGYRNDELIGTNITPIVFKNNSEEKKHIPFDRLLKGETIIKEQTIISITGKEVETEMYSKMLNNDSFQLIFHDISKQKINEEKLNLSLNTYRSIIDSITEAIYIQDENGIFLDVNSASVRMYGYDHDFFIGKTPDFLSAPDKNDLTMVSTAVNEAFNGKPQRFDFWGKKKDGTIFPKEVSLTHGNYYGQKAVIAVSRDITKRKLTESALEESEAKFKALVENSSDMIWETNIEKQYTYVSPNVEKLLGYKANELLGKTPFEFMLPDEAVRMKKISDKIVEQKNIYQNLVNTLQSKNGSNVILETTGIPYFDSKGVYKGYRGINRNISDRVASEKNIKINEEKYRSLIENMHEGLLLIDSSDRIVYASPAFCKMLGYSSEELIVKSVHDLIIGEKDYLKTFTPSFTDNKKVFDHFEVFVHTKDGETLCLLLNISFIKDDSGNNSGYMISCLDVTESRKAKDALRENEEMFRSISENAFDMISLIDLNGSYAYNNNAFKDIMGYAPEEKKGENYFELIHPDDLDKAVQMFREGITERKKNAMMTYRLVCKDGSYKWIDNRTTLIMDPQGMPLKILIIGQDITQRMRSVNALQESEARYKAVTYTASDAIITYDTTGIIMDWNRGAESIFGYSKEEAEQNMHVSILIHKNMRDEYKKYLTPDHHEINLTSETKSFDMDGLHKNGKLIPIELSVSAWAISSEKYFTLIIRDITEKKLAREELINAKEKAEEHDRLKSTFLANISHEIRTPMNGILGFAELLQTTELSEEDQKKYIDLIDQSGRRMLNIINEIVDISKIEAGEMKTFIQETNINQVINDTYLFFMNEAKLKNLNLDYSVSLPDSACKIETDQNKLAQILTNLIKNAMKFTVSGGIQFGYLLKDSMLEFYVKDTGIGITPEQKKIVFERFRQANMTRTRNYDGVGLGLSISKAYIEMLGGTIWVESEFGAGTTFFFTIPYNQKKID